MTIVCLHFDFYCIIVAGIGEIRNNNDASCTYEGENNVLVQQTSNWLLSVRRQGFSHFKNVTPMGTASFFAKTVENLSRKFTFNGSLEALQPDSKFLLDFILFVFEDKI